MLASDSCLPRETQDFPFYDQELAVILLLPGETPNWASQIKLRNRTLSRWDVLGYVQADIIPFSSNTHLNLIYIKDTYWCLYTLFYDSERALLASKTCNDVSVLPLFLSVSAGFFHLDCCSLDNGKLSLFRQFRELLRSCGIIVTSHFLGQFNKRQFISTVIFMWRGFILEMKYCWCV